MKKCLFVTQDAKTQPHTYCLYKTPDEYVVCSYIEISEYEAMGYKRSSNDFAKEAAEARAEVEKIDEEIKVLKKRKKAGE